MMMSKSKLAALALMSTLFAPMASEAATYSQSKTAKFDVTMKIVADCTISAAGLDFGQNQGVISNAVSANSNISVTCTNTTPYNVGLNAGTGTGSNGTSRYMSGTGANTGTVQFNLYRSQGSGLWGDTQGTDTMSGVGNGTLQTLTVYGEIPVQTTPMPDSYKSSVTATVYF
jgi:spore coat protein U-like protein